MYNYSIDRIKSKLLIIAISFLLLTLIYYIWYYTAYLEWYTSAIIVPSLELIAIIMLIISFKFKHELKNESFIKTGFIFLGIAAFFPIFFYYYGIFSYIAPALILLFIIFLYKSKKYVKNDYYFLAIVFIIMLENLIFLYRIIPKFGTDEISFDYYSAYVFLKGFNPYSIVINTSILKSLGINPMFYTPLSTGGIANKFSYPALAFLIFIPAVLLKFSPGIIVSFFGFLIIFILFMFLKKYNLSYIFIFMAAVIIFDPLFYQYALGGMTGYIWLSFLMVSYYFFTENKNVMSGIFFGLSLSSKQFGAYILIPFIYMVYREYGIKNTVKFIVSMLVIFLVFNLPFILLSPKNYINSIISPLTEPLIGIGSGFSQIAFLDIYYIPNIYFTVIEFALLIFLWLLFIVKYDRYKLILFAIPMIALQFNFRSLFNYIIPWEIIFIMAVVFIFSNKKNADNINKKLKLFKEYKIKAKKSIMTLILFIVIFIIIFTGIESAIVMHDNNKPDIKFNVVSVNITGNNITSIVLNITGNLNSLNKSLYRAFYSPPMYSGNGVILSVHNEYFHYTYAIVNLTTEKPNYLPYKLPVEILISSVNSLYSRYITKSDIINN